MTKENILLAEYNSLKVEQIERIKVRDNLIYLALGSFGGLFSFAIIQNQFYVTALLPIVSFVLAWVYITNDSKVSQIGRYIQNHLSKQVNKELNVTDAFDWENKFKTTSMRKIRSFFQFLTEVITFIIPPVFSLLFLDLNKNPDFNIFIFNIILIFTSFILFCIYTCNKGSFKYDES